MARTMPPLLSHVRVWIFDLDNTLYPASANLFDLVDARMTAYIADRLAVDPVEARAIQKGYFKSHGTTLSGLMATHAVDPHEFLAFVHDIALDRIDADARLVEQIAALPGRKLVFTNGDRDYAQRILDRLGLGESFEAVHDIHAMGLVPKPDLSAYQGLCAAHDIDPARALFADDMARNLLPAKQLGMATLWLDNGSEQADGAPCPSFVDHRTNDLGRWLDEILEGVA